MPAGDSALARIVRSRPAWKFSTCALLGWGFVVWFGLAGCDQQADIVVERVPKDDEIAAPPVADAQSATEQRMLAAMVLGDEDAIFFKVMGPPEALEKQRESFISLVSSYKPGDPPTWTVPAGWTETPGQGERLATIEVPAEPPLELSVTSLPLRMDDQEAYRLANVNRWRGQLGLSPIDRAALHASSESGAETFEIPLEGDAVATVVDMSGKGGGGMGGPFASMIPRGNEESSGGTSSATTGETSTGPTFETPEGWTEAPGNAFSQVSLAVDDARITVSGLSASANDLLANVNRWRRQVGLDPLAESDLKEQVGTITLGDGQEGRYVVLAGSEGQSMLGVIATRGETMWFVKMMGGEATISREKPRFEEFVKSLRFK